jgi:hypothetical protein
MATSYSVPGRKRCALSHKNTRVGAGEYADRVQDHATTLELLREFIAALDRRVPQIERAGEAAIADEAAHLRARAAERIAEIEKLDALPARER